MLKNVKFTAILLIAIFCITSIVSCGPSQEKVEAVQNKYAELLNLHNEIVELCEIFEIGEDTEIGQAVNEYADLLNSIHNEDLNNCSNDELDSFISDLNEAIDALASAKTVLQDLAVG